MAAPTYIIYRDSQAGEPFDPTSPLLFFPPKGSDELFDALRLAFPLAKTHSERMRDAIIRYLLEERQEEQASSLQPSPVDDHLDMSMNWSTLSSTPAMSQATAPSVLPSPETFDLNTPASTSFSTNSPIAQLSRHTSDGTFCESSPPSLDQLTGVFSLSTSPQPKQRVRRKMTEAEKVEYRKRRIVKACDKCARRKRKCPHNQAEMETLVSATTSKSSSRVAKFTSPKSKISTSLPTFHNGSALDPNLFDLAHVDFTTFDPTTFVPLEDFDMFDEPFPELDMHDFAMAESSSFFTPDLSWTCHDWQHGLTERFDPLTSVSHDGFSVEDMAWATQPHMVSAELFNSSNDLRRQLPLEPQRAQVKPAGMRANASMSSSSDSLCSLDASSPQSGGSDSSGGNGNQMLWEHLRTGQLEKPQPTHTAHVHDSEAAGLSRLDDNPQALSPTVLPLSRAGRTFKPCDDLMHVSRAHPKLRTVAVESLVDSVKDRKESFSSFSKDVQQAAVSTTTSGRAAVSDGSSPTTSRRRPQVSTSSSSAPSDRAIDPSLRRRRYFDPSLGEGIPNDRSPGYQLYAARKRISAVKNTFVGANMNAGLPVGGDANAADSGGRGKTLSWISGSGVFASSPSSTTKGGAYLRREGEEAASEMESLPLLQTIQRGADARAPSSSSPLLLESSHDISLGLTEKEEARGQTTRISSSNNTADKTALDFTRNTTSAATPQIYRLCDTHKCRDHHGRSAPLGDNAAEAGSPVLLRSLLAIIALGLVILCAYIGPSSVFAPSVIALALLTPPSNPVVHEANDNDANYNGIITTKLVQCTTKNSRWLSFSGVRSTLLLLSSATTGRLRKHLLPGLRSLRHLLASTTALF